MKAYLFIVSSIACYGLFYAGWQAGKRKAGFFGFLGYTAMVVLAWAVVAGVPLGVQAILRDKKNRERTEVVEAKREIRANALKWARNDLKLKAGKEPAPEKLQQAMEAVRAKLREADVELSDIQWREFAQANLPVKWTGTEWVRDEAKWASQWTR